MAESAGKRQTRPTAAGKVGGYPEGIDDYDKERRDAGWKIQTEEGNPDVDRVVKEGDEQGEQVQAAVEKEDDDFDPENPDATTETNEGVE